MTIVTRAPTRIDFAGGWTDVPEFANREGGIVVNAAITLYAHVELMFGGNKIKLAAEDLDERETVQSSDRLTYDGPLLLHKAALNMLPVTGGIELISRSDAPLGSGLGGSGALDVALLAALARARLEDYDGSDLAELAYELEARELGLQGGRQDQYAAALGGVNRLEFADGSVRVQSLEVSPEMLREFHRVVVLVYTGQTHFSSQTHERVWNAYRAADSDVTDALRAIRDVAGACSASLEAGDWKRSAELVDENWRQQQRLDVTISTSKTRNIEQGVRAAGAWGLKATGAGAGGCLAILTDPTRRDHVEQAARAYGGQILAFEFCSGGVEVVEPEDAARHS